MDYGGDGSRVMFLIYNMDNMSDIIGGSLEQMGQLMWWWPRRKCLYRGGVTIATIKTGAGLRMGANVGYIKFSENPKWLPF